MNFGHARLGPETFRNPSLVPKWRIGLGIGVLALTSGIAFGVIGNNLSVMRFVTLFGVAIAFFSVTERFVVSRTKWMTRLLSLALWCASFYLALQVH